VCTTTDGNADDGFGWICYHLLECTLSSSSYGLNRHYENHWIGHHGPIPWLLRSPNLTTLDLFLWGLMNEMTYRTTVHMKGTPVLDYGCCCLHMCRRPQNDPMGSKLLKMTVFWVVVLCSLHNQGDDGGSKDLWNVGKLLPDYTVLQPRR
jgi:hypothetical protein